MSTLTEFAKQVDRLSTSLSQLAKHENGSPDQVIGLAEKAMQECRAIDFLALCRALEAANESIAQKLEQTIELRREDLAASARSSGLAFKRMGSFDQLDIFKISYKRGNVIVEIGSEKFKELSIADGAKLCEALTADLNKLRRADFSRASFLATLKMAIALAKEAGKSRDGKVKVKDLFPYFVSAVQLSSSDFVKKPSKASFNDYSKAEFAYDLARFGEEGWECGGSKIRSQGPNMASQADALALPRKAGYQGTIEQVLTIWVE